MSHSSSKSGRVVAVIPARYGSSRFPGKPLAMIAGRLMIQRVVERATAAALVDEVIVATDDRRIFDAVQAFGGRAVMTSPDHPSGTDRIAEAVRGVEADLVINVQGDEPLIPPRVIDALVAKMRESGSEMGTVAVTLDPESAEFANPNIVKAVVDATGRALYFSRAAIPFQRADGEPMPALWHWGIYAYRREFLEQFVTWPPSPLEKCEKLEQLRALEHGARIQVLTETESWSIGVDVPEDVAKVEALLKKLEQK